MVTEYDLAGLAGILLLILAYARVQWRRDYAKRPAYSWLNLFGAALLGVALLQYPTPILMSAVAAWGLVSLYGLYRCNKYLRRSKVLMRRLNRTKNDFPAA